MYQENQEQEKNKKRESVKETGAPEYSIRTMRADLARLRLSEAKQERKKIIDLQKQQPRAEEAEEAEEAKAPEPEEPVPGIEPVLVRKGLERKKITLLKEQAGLRQNINTLNKGENEANQEIAKINRQKKLVQNEDQVKELNRQKEEFLNRKQAVQAGRVKYQERLKDLEKELQETDIKIKGADLKPEEKAETAAPPFKKEISDAERVAQAKQRLEKLTRQQEKREEKQDSAFMESLETRWKKQPGKKIPPEIEMPPIKPVKEYPHKPTEESRELRRIAIIGISAFFIILTGAFLFWFLTKGPSSVPPSLPEPPVVPERPEEPEEPEKPIPSVTLIPIDEEKVIEIQNNAQIGLEIKKALTQGQDQEMLARLLFKNTTENSFVGFQDFLQAFEVKMPDGLLEKLENYATFFTYSYDKTGRFGFVSKIEKGEDIEGQMRKWEETMELDMDKLLTLLGKEDSAGTNIFKSADYKGVMFRYLSVGKQDFGMCWTQYKGLLVFTTSGKTILKAIDALQYE